MGYEVSKNTLHTCLTELELLIKCHDGKDEGNAVIEEEGSMSPLARAKLRIEEDAAKLRQELDEPFEVKGNVLDDLGKGMVLGAQHAASIIDGVGEETGEETDPIDNLTSEVFAARDEIEKVLNEAP